MLCTVENQLSLIGHVTAPQNPPFVSSATAQEQKKDGRKRKVLTVT